MHSVKSLDPSKLGSCWLAPYLLRNAASVSKLFQPINLAPKDSTLITKDMEPLSKSQKLFTEMGIVKQNSPGMFAFLPLGLRALDKISSLIDSELQRVGCQKLSLPSLTPKELWEKTGRWDSAGPELFSLEDRHQRLYTLSPTHEEAITELVATLPGLNYKKLPLLLYQTTNKYRDEARPRFGLLRSREFIMKDLYTFDESIEAAKATYKVICSAYDRIFQRLGVPYVKVLGDTGNIGGSLSHEYHYPCTVGEDTLKCCSKCGYAANLELCLEEKCPKCSTELEISKGVEVGHAFLLGTKYSDALGARFVNNLGKSSVCQMGCYGIGVSRLIAASVEVLCTEEEIRWPHPIAPYQISILLPKYGSKEGNAISLGWHVATILDEHPSFRNDVLVDDRPGMTVGKKLMEAKKTGFPFVLVFGKKAVEDIPKIEIHNLLSNEVVYLSVSETCEYLCKRAIAY